MPQTSRAVIISIVLILTTEISQVQCRTLSEVNEESILCTSLYEIIKNLPSITTIDIIAHPPDVLKFNTHNCIKMLSELNEHHAYTINAINSGIKKNFVIFIIDTFGNIIDPTANVIMLSKFDVSGNYLIVMRNFRHISLELIFAYLWRQYNIYNVNILALDEIDNIVRMFTFYPFSIGNCSNTNPITINEFNNRTKKWVREIIFPSKLRDFHNCPINAIVCAYGPSAQETIFSNGSKLINGSDVEILRGIASALNANLLLEILTEPGSWGQVFETGTMSGAFEFLNNGSADIAANFYYLMELRSRFFQYSHAYYSIKMVIITPQRPQFSALQKLSRPFSIYLWIYTAIVILCCFIAVFIIKKQSKSIQLLFLDKNINAPALQLLVVLFGSSQHVLPRNDFSRMLLMSFVFFTFILRSLYVGSLYKFLQSDGRMRDFQTIDELIENDLKFVIDPTVEDMVKYQKFYNRRKVANTAQYYKFIDETLNPTSTHTVVDSSDEVIYMNKHSINGISYSVLNEIVLTVPTVFYMRKNSYLTNIINEKIDDLLSNGLINYWISKYLDDKYLRLKPLEGGPDVLDIDELYGAFQLLVLGLICSFISFIVEVLRMNINRIGRKGC
ncbi:uncharacterized protein [Chironomus tepperi]|uniref:uncharacterized protein n=1 Tax=Chironomus tepperi TaxID=113505 RepID=UPI00391F0D7E